MDAQALIAGCFDKLQVKQKTIDVCVEHDRQAPVVHAFKAGLHVGNLQVQQPAVYKAAETRDDFPWPGEHPDITFTPVRGYHVRALLQQDTGGLCNRLCAKGEIIIGIYI